MNVSKNTGSAEILAKIFQSGVVGAGGAGFPTHVKLTASADTVILNGAECEPLLHKDKQLLTLYADKIVEGLKIARQLVQAKRVILGIKAKYTELIDLVSRSLDANMRIEGLPDAYPSGDEQTLVFQTTGRIIPPGKIPLNVGCVVMNVETAYNTAAAVLDDAPVTHKFVTITGAVNRPISVRVPLGATLGDCLKAAGGPAIEEFALVVGGVMMGKLANSVNDLVTKTTGGLIVLPEDHVVVRQMRRTFDDAKRIGRAACDQCSHCTELCPRYLLGHPVEPHRAMRSLIFSSEGKPAVPGTQFCCECNLCTRISCPEGLDPRAVMAKNKQEIFASGQRWTDAPIQEYRSESLLPNRRTPTARLISRLALTDYDRHADLVPNSIDVSRVGIVLKQHVGAPCVAVVKSGDPVRHGQIIGEVPVTDGKRALGVPVHSSIEGTVRAVENGIVWIEK